VTITIVDVNHIWFILKLWAIVMISNVSKATDLIGKTKKKQADRNIRTMIIHSGTRI